ncbi:MAG: hypothetical protein CVU05_00120 [Bacteroidetes bacterium HGW-Bacteroidetes-21]|jgi:pimeloyl-ACP methyl ester carboxylesterase|nr:MAG: hypothetical protein CVU05_00120 [Bacteroidetes bacterium HGW-Bacteroidetes-21]
MMKTAIIILISLIVSSCIRLDDFFYNANYNPITSYQLDDYTGPTEFTLDTSYKIDKSKINLFQLSSDMNGDIKNIYALYVGDMSRIATDTVILYCHGNKDHLDFYYPRIQLLANTGGKNRYGVMSLDYRGFGLSEGKPSEEALYADVNAALLWLKSKGLTGDRLIMYGFSMGTAPATELTGNPEILQPAGLVLEAPFASAEVFVQDAAGLSIPGTYIVNLQINNAFEIQKVHVPLLWIHGKIDDFISMKSHGEVVYANHPGTKFACRVTGANHSDCPVLLGYSKYLTIMEDFITGTLTQSSIPE